MTTRGGRAVSPEGVCCRTAETEQGRDTQAQERGLRLWTPGVWSEVTESPFSGFSLNSTGVFPGRSVLFHILSVLDRRTLSDKSLR